MVEHKSIIHAVLIGNPNVGKSTVFNALTGLKQHTGNWAGKTVGCAEGKYSFRGTEVYITDLPGIYSLSTHSPEEEEAKSYLISSPPDCVVCVCDSCCLERNLILVLQLKEICPNIIICLNLIDEAEKKRISIDTRALSMETGAKVVKTSARNKTGLSELKEAIVSSAEEYEECPEDYTSCGENALESPSCPLHSPEYYSEKASNIASLCTKSKGDPTLRDRRIDRVLCGRFSGFAIMLFLLAGVFWLTLVGSGYLSDGLSLVLSYISRHTFPIIDSILPPNLSSLLCDGVLSTVFRVISVMLPPMAIFFPLFTILEDLGYLPRVAFNLDRCFSCCGSCGKQSLTMLMGLGCNAAGVTGCRIIDSARERKIAIITNSLVPCNGRFPLIIAALGCLGLGDTLSSFALLLLFILSVIVTLLTSKLLSCTLLRGEPSSFTLELPPYRPPQFGKVILRSVLDRTVFVLGRAVSSAIPAGVIIWICGNVALSGDSIYSHLVRLFDPAGRLAGMDGILLLSFILALPAAELMLPLAIAGAEMASGAVGGALFSDPSNISAVFAANGWGVSTVICVIVFMMFHFPCATTLITVYKETKSLKLTAMSAVIPTVIGYLMCVAINILGGFL